MSTSLTWRKSSYSGGGNDCVEVAWPAMHTGHGVRAVLRDSKNPDGGQLSFTEASWASFLAAIRD
ncbi:MAG: DUF397 domain-containing protein [Sciscionella sp.]|nr:DUF397 domain-containing protein [Sciscionella sp.]